MCRQSEKPESNRRQERIQILYATRMGGVKGSNVNPVDKEARKEWVKKQTKMKVSGWLHHTGMTDALVGVLMRE